jgi:tRNA1(Val) A37 N6-methylase TrmN6
MAEEAKFTLIESIKDSGVELKIMDPLILHEFDKSKVLALNRDNKTF